MRSAWCVLVLMACAPRGHDKQTDAAVGNPQHDAALSADAEPDAEIDAAIAAASCQPTFRLDGHGSAQSVWMSGDFVAWAPDPSAGATALSLGADGAWTVKHPFNAGVYLYKFIVDGSQWIADPTNPDTVADGFGGQNSRYTCNP